MPPISNAREWQRPDWPERAARALDAALAEVGRTRMGDPSPVHSWDLVAVIRAETDAGTVYFKASETGREASVTALLSRTLPELLPPLLWADPEVGLMLSGSGGNLLDGVDELEAWEEAARKLARFQRQADASALAAFSCPAYPLDEMAERVDAFLADTPPLRAWGVGEEDLATLTAARPTIRAAFRNLAALGLPDLPAHGDAHPRNALHGARGSMWFDWSEAASGAHPFMDAGWFLWWTLSKGKLRVRQAHPDLETRLARAYLTGLECPDAAPLLLGSLPLALLHRATVYDANFRRWEGTLPGWRPNYVPYFLGCAAGELTRL